MPTDAPARWWTTSETPTRREAETAADKRLYVEAGMAPIACRRCGTEVLVKKNSQKHTAVQWTCDPAASCPEFAAGVASGSREARIMGCPSLKETIADAVADGTLAVPGA